MANDNELEYTPGEPKLYIYKLSIPITGIVDSDAPLDYTREVLEKNLRELHGEAMDLIEIREATPEEIEAFTAFYDIDNQTIN